MGGAAPVAGRTHDLAQRICLRGSGRRGRALHDGHGAVESGQTGRAGVGRETQSLYHVIGCAAHVDLAKFDPARGKWVKPAVVRGPVTDNPCGVLACGWQLRPSGLPEQRHDLWRGGNVRARLPRWSAAPKLKFGAEAAPEQVADWTRLLRDGAALTLPARHEVTVLVDTDDYLCGFPVLEFSGGAGTTVRWEWAESLFEKEESKAKFDNTLGWKGDRSAVAGKFSSALAILGNSAVRAGGGSARRGGGRGAICSSA